MVAFFGIIANRLFERQILDAEFAIGIAQKQSADRCVVVWPLEDSVGRNPQIAPYAKRIGRIPAGCAKNCLYFFLAADERNI